CAGVHRRKRMLDFWTWHGRVGRARYLATGLILFALKYNLDRIVAGVFGYRWSVINYEYVLEDAHDISFYIALVAVALPFFWIGVVLTLRRLRDADLPLWGVMLLFVPFLNLIFFAILSAIPSRETSNDGSKLGERVGRFIPQS